MLPMSQEGKQRLLGEPVDVGVWAGQASSGGLSVTETEERRIAVRTEAGRRAQSTREVRRGKATKAGAAK